MLMFDLPPPPMVPAEAPQEVVERLERPTPLTRQCLEHVSKRYEVHPVILSLIARVEGGYNGAKIENTDGSWDLGFMQVNTIHLPLLSNYGITEKMLQNNACVSIGFAAWYVRKVTIDQKAVGSEDYFRAIARYHSKNEPYKTRYAEKLQAEFVKAFGEQIQVNDGSE